MNPRACVVPALLALTLVAPVSPAAATESHPARADRSTVLAAVRAGSPTSASLRSMTKLARARVLGRCIPIAELHYCLGFGWGARPDYAAVANEPAPVRPTGDLTMSDWVRKRAAMTDAARKAAEVEEVETAL